MTYGEQLNLLYQSPLWFDHLSGSCREECLLLSTATGGAEDPLTGIAAIRVGNFNLKFNIRSLSLLTVNLKAAFILGSHPLLPNDPGIFDRFFASLIDRLPKCECIYMDNVRSDSFLWNCLHRSNFLRENFLIYIPDGVRPFHFIRLPGTFEEYLSKFKAKKRYNLNWQVKNFQEQVGEKLTLSRHESPGDIDRFLEGASSVARCSWQHKALGPRIENNPQFRERFTDLARRGIFRSYLLSVGDKPSAFVLGYQSHGTYQYVEIAYDPGYRKFSPGSVLLFLLIGDLYRHRHPEWLNFGIGDALYKQEFGNMKSSDASILIFRKNPANRILCNAHKVFRDAVNVGKKIYSFRKGG